MKSLLITLVAPHSSPNPLLFHLNFSSFISPQPKISRIGPPPLYPHPPSIPPLVIVLIDHAIVLWWEHNFTLGHNIYPPHSYYRVLPTLFSEGQILEYINYFSNRISALNGSSDIFSNGSYTELWTLSLQSDRGGFPHKKFLLKSLSIEPK